MTLVSISAYDYFACRITYKGRIPRQDSLAARRLLSDAKRKKQAARSKARPVAQIRAMPALTAASGAPPGFDAVESKKRWTEDDIALLRTIGEILVNARFRGRAGTAGAQNAHRCWRLSPQSQRGIPS